MKDSVAIDPKWIASLYALSATAVCILIFTYSSVDFLTALLKTFFTAISFYLIGIITSALINFIVINFASKEEKIHKTSEEPVSEKE